MKEWKRKIQTIAYLLPATMLLACVVESLSGYVKPTFQVKALESGEETETEETAPGKEETLPDKAEESLQVKVNKNKNKTVALPPESEQESEQEPDSGAAKTPEKILDAEGYQNGVYYGTGTGFGGTIKVKVTVKKEKIYKIRVMESQDGKSYLSKAASLFGQIIKKQSTNVDVVSGATYSSNGLIEAVRDALKKAEKSKEKQNNNKINKDTSNKEKKEDKTKDKAKTSSGKFPYKDGVYFGTGEGYRGDITAAVCICDHSIQYIMITEASDDDAFLTKAKSTLATVMKKQSTDVDVVSGATFSSNGIIEAIKNAFVEAKDNDTSLPAQAEEAEPAPVPTEKTESMPTQAGEAEPAPVPTEEPESMPTQAEETGPAPVQAEEPASTPSPMEAPSSGEDSTQILVYINGEYQAETICSPDIYGDFDAYPLSLKITVENDRITSITNVAGSGDSYDSGNDFYIKRALDGTSKYPGVAGQIVSKGTYEGVDAVSGATCSSNAIIGAVKKALETAKNNGSM